MNKEHNEPQQVGEDYLDLVVGLEKLGRAIDSAEYPGRAWSEPQKSNTKWLIRILTASAAAAVVICAIALHNRFNTPEAILPQAATTLQTEAIAMNVQKDEPLFNLELPANLALGPTRPVKITPPTASLPEITNISPAVSVDFQPPTLSSIWTR